MTRHEPLPGSPPPRGYEDFFRLSYRDLVKAAMFAGATLEEAEDATSEALEQMLRIWPRIESPRAYAHKAVIHNFIKAKTRGIPRIANRLIERDGVQRVDSEDRRLTEREEWDWVECVLSNLPSAQREVMQCIAEGLSRKESMTDLGITGDVFRRRLCDARANLAQILNPDGEFKQSSSSSREEGR